MRSFAKHKADVPYLFRVPTCLIRIDQRYIAPTDWDQSVVWEDLVDHVSLQRQIKSTPALAIKSNAIVAINGAPFVKAALSVEPVIECIICQSRDRLDEFDGRARPTSAREALEELEDTPHAKYWQVVYFSDVLNIPKIDSVISLIVRTNCVLTPPFPRIVGGRTAVSWQTGYLTLDDAAGVRTVSAIREIASRHGVSSFNGTRVAALV